jgi:hypothetical protein
MNHETQRLLVAASRGARVQSLHWIKDVWVTVEFVDFDAAKRIHPDDIELQYGPISTELRKVGSTGQWSENYLSYLASNWLCVCFGSSNGNFSWLCLFAAELAADEGM